MSSVPLPPPRGFTVPAPKSTRGITAAPIETSPEGRSLVAMHGGQVTEISRGDIMKRFRNGGSGAPPLVVGDDPGKPEAIPAPAPAPVPETPSIPAPAAPPRSLIQVVIGIPDIIDIRLYAVSVFLEEPGFMTIMFPADAGNIPRLKTGTEVHVTYNGRAIACRGIELDARFPELGLVSITLLVPGE